MCLVSAAYHPYPSGISEHVSHLAKALSELGAKVEVLTTRYAATHDDSSEPVPVTRVGRARMVPLNGSYATMPTGLALPRQVERYFAERTFDVVHCHGVFWPELSYWSIRHSRAVHVVSFLSSGFGNTGPGGGLHRRVFARHLARIDGRVALSERARRTYAPYVPGDCRIIPSGVDLTRFRPGARPLAAEPLRDASPGASAAADPAAATRAAGAVLAAGAGILFVGRLDRRKGLEVLLRAMPSVLRSVPVARLTVVGSGPGDSSARALVRSLALEDRVTFVGRVSREALPGHYSAADVYCSPALGGESFGIVLLEAMASGVPVVASDIPGYDETVERDIDGVLVPPGDPRGLSEGLVRVLRGGSLALRLREAGRRKAARHAWPTIGARTLALYEELLGGVPRGSG